jgi:phage FluMu protein Com
MEENQMIIHFVGSWEYEKTRCGLIMKGEHLALTTEKFMVSCPTCKTMNNTIDEEYKG